MEIYENSSFIKLVSIPFS